MTTEYRILQRRPLSARLVFFTAAARRDDGVSAQGQKTTTELIVKEGAYEGEGGVAHVRRDVRAGDVVRIDVVVTEGGAAAAAANNDDATVVVRGLAVVERWRDSAAGKDGRTFCWSAPVAPPSARPAAAATAAATVTTTVAATATTATVATPAAAPAMPTVTATVTAPGPATATATATATAEATAEATAAPCTTPACKFYVNTGRCAKGAGCPYGHDASAAQRLAWVRGRAARRQGAAVAAWRGVDGDGAKDGLEEEGVVEGHGGTAAAKTQRARIFAAWIGAAFFGRAAAGEDEAGREEVRGPACAPSRRRPDSVVDVAGGRGALTFELSVLRGGGGGGGRPPLLLGRDRVTLVDPRPLRLSRKQALRLRLQEREAGGPGGGEAAGGGGGGRRRGWRVDDVLTGAVVAEGRPPAASAATEASASSPGAAASPPPPAAVFRQARAELGPALWRSEAWRRAVEGGGGGGDEGDKKHGAPAPARPSRSFPVVVALHPDQATGAALDYALERGLPFAIAPCCVFPALFPGRRLACGAPVRSYGDLVDYLRERGGGEAGVLPFQGRNVVVYGGGAGAARGGVDAAAAGAAAAAEAARAPAEFRPRGDGGSVEDEAGGLFDGAPLLAAAASRRM